MEIGRPSGPRKSVNLLVQLAEEGVNDFVEEKYATDISSGGMFVWTRTPKPVGTGFQVRVEIAGGARLLQGHALVRWTRKDNDPNGPPGMGLEFTNVDPASAALIDRMMKPAEGTDLAAELTNALANELSNELDAGAEFTDDFAAAPPVSAAGEESGDFTDDFTAVPAAAPEDFTEDFEELETAPAGVMIPKHLQQGGDAEELLTEPFGMKLPGPPVAEPPKPAPEPLGVAAPSTTPYGLPMPVIVSPPGPSLAEGVPDTTPQMRALVPLDEDVPDTDPRGTAVPAQTLTEDGFADTAQRPAYKPGLTPMIARSTEDGTADTGKQAAYVPAAAPAPGDEGGIADTAKRGAMSPEAARNLLAGLAEPAPAAPPPDAEAFADTDRRAAMSPAQARSLLEGLGTAVPPAADEGTADTAQRPAFVPGLKPDLARTADEASAETGRQRPIRDGDVRPPKPEVPPAEGTEDTAQRPAFVPAGRPLDEGARETGQHPQVHDDGGVGDTAQRPAFAPAGRPLDEGARETGQQPQIHEDDGLGDTAQRPVFVPAGRPLDEGLRETGEQRQVRDDATVGAVPRPPAIDEGTRETGQQRQISDEEAVADTAQRPAFVPPTAEVPIDADVRRTPLEQPVPIDADVRGTPLEQPVPIDADVKRTPLEQPAAVAPPPPSLPVPTPGAPALAIDADVKPVAPTAPKPPVPIAPAAAAEGTPAPLFGGGLAIPPSVPVRPSAPRGSGRWSGVPKSAELRTEAVGLPAPEPARAEPPPAPKSAGRWSGAPKTAELRTEAQGLPVPAPAESAARIDLKAAVPAPAPSPPPAAVERTIVGPMPVLPPDEPEEAPVDRTSVGPMPGAPPSAPSAKTAIGPLPVAPPSAPPPPSAPSAKTAIGPLPMAPPSAPSAKTAIGPLPVTPAPAPEVPPAPVPAPMLAALRAQRTPDAAPEGPDPLEAVFELEETVEAPPDRTVRAPLPVASPAPQVFDTSETPSDDRTGQFDMSAFAEASRPPEPVPPPRPAAKPDRVLAANPFAEPRPAPAPSAPRPVLQPSDPSPLASPRTQRATGLKPAVQPRPEAAAKGKKEAVAISVKELVRSTPKPPEPETTSVVVDVEALQAPAAPGPVARPAPAAPAAPAGQPLPRRSVTREVVALPRGVLKPVAKRSKKVDELKFLGPPPDFVKDSPLVGIDLGTTNSVCAVLAGGRPVVLKTGTGSNIVPSLVAINKAQKLAVGFAAHAEFLHNPAQVIYGSKRLVGRDFDSPAVDAVRERFAYEIVAGPDGKAAVMLGGKQVSLEEVQAIILTECRLMAEKFLSKRVSRAVVTCPAYFTEPQRQSIRVAGALAGLRVERILIEPTAAALAYGLNQDLSRKVLVYDVGGGTFDATLLRIEKNVFEVLATGGDVFLGGLDFDHQLIDALVKRFEAEHNVLFNADPGALARIADQAEKAKIALSEKESVEVRLPMLQMGDRGRAMGLSCTLTRAELEEFSTPLVERTLEVVQSLLKDAKLKASDIDEVVLVGGMSRMPMVRSRLRQLFKKQPHASINAEEAIAVGAALFTGVVDQVSNVVLIDVAPMTIGFGMPGGAYKRVIQRNTPLPASASMGVATTEDMSEVIEVEVFQGEDPDVAVNDYVGTIRIDGLPKAPKGVVKVAINLKLDANCVLHVDARELQTRRRFESTLATRYTTAEVQKKLGIKPQAAKAAVAKRTEEIKKRSSGGLFGFLKSAFSRKK